MLWSLAFKVIIIQIISLTLLGFIWKSFREKTKDFFARHRKGTCTFLWAFSFILVVPVAGIVTAFATSTTTYFLIKLSLGFRHRRLLKNEEYSVFQNQ